jgi:hypothetical protein
LDKVAANILDLLMQITRQSLEPMVNSVTITQASGTRIGQPIKGRLQSLDRLSGCRLGPI